jgi:hypothetical protein
MVETELGDVSDLDNLCTRLPEDFGLEPEESGPSSCNVEDKLSTKFDVL